MSSELALEQRLVDLAEEMKAAVAALAQGVADASEALEKSGTNLSLEQTIADLGETLEGILAAVRGGISVAAPTVNVEVKVPEQQAPQVNVSPVIKIPQQSVELHPKIEVSVPAAPPAQVTVVGAKSWRTTFEYEERTGRLLGATHTRVDPPTST